MTFVSASCQGVMCALCSSPSAHKIGEEIPSDDPNRHRHNLTVYVCEKHFAHIMHGSRQHVQRLGEATESASRREQVLRSGYENVLRMARERVGNRSYDKVDVNILGMVIHAALTGGDDPDLFREITGTDPEAWMTELGWDVGNREVPEWLRDDYRHAGKMVLETVRLLKLQDRED